MAKCKQCDTQQDEKELEKRKYICPKCGTYIRMGAWQRIRMVVDKNSFKEWLTDVEDSNPLKDDTYAEKLQKAREKTGLHEAMVVGKATVFGEEIVLCVSDAAFLMASMGKVIGEKIAGAVEKATYQKLPVFIFCCSGGARMQEGVVSLMQMEKTAAALARHSDAGLFCSTILTDPTTGGVTASYAMLGDVIMAEPGALIGFAGQRVIKQTIGQDLPEGFQTAEFQCDHGMVDGIVERKRLRKMIQFLTITNRYMEGYANFNGNFKSKFQPWKRENLRSLFKTQKSAWERVKGTRRVSRPSTLDYISNIFDVFIELKGDRCFGDDKALLGGIALLDGQPVTLITEYRGKEMNEIVARNFGMPEPEGYRKALRLMKQAEKFNRPIITFINTSGAYCGIEAEERGQGEAIARNLFEMARLRVPVLAIIVGEAGSGGALAT
ncbi:MAG: acetyl-CoA carboxylase carboxyl transferase subunit beta, partial [Lachnospiraceae bacterium]|nr:acetyl-CoA carboxylase carboxyl transferase subunit beta [Lachnospiraceae bacterium]